MKRNVAPQQNRVGSQAAHWARRLYQRDTPIEHILHQAELEIVRAKNVDAERRDRNFRRNIRQREARELVLLPNNKKPRRKRSVRRAAGKLNRPGRKFAGR